MSPTCSGAATSWNLDFKWLQAWCNPLLDLRSVSVLQDSFPWQAKWEVECSFSEQTADGLCVESSLDCASSFVHSVYQMDQALGRCSQELSKPSVFCISESAPFVAYG